jgi:NifU-like protein involved in Fe-S cluster formation
MADLDDIYNQRIFELAAAIPHAERLARPDASATAHSKLCGSTIEVELELDGDRISGFGQKVKACLLGQASAAIVGREIIGTREAEFRSVAATMRRMLKEGGERPDGRWADLGLLQPVKDYPHRHASTLLVFEAVERALDQAREGRAPADAAVTAERA